MLSCAASSVEPVTVPLEYKTQASPNEFPQPLPCGGGLSGIDVTDARTTQVIGTRYPQSEPTMRADVTSSGDVASWIRTGGEALLRGSGIISPDGRGPVLRLRLDSITTDESVYHRAVFNGKIAMTAELVGPDGRSCWHDAVEGASKNYGYEGSVENYQETLNHALDRAFIQIFGSSAFRDAACGCK